MDKDLIVANAKEVRLKKSITLRQACELLEKCREKGENVYIDFQGRRLYSEFDDFDSCYLKITGKNYEEFQRYQRAWLEVELYQANQARLEKMYELIEGGKIILTREMYYEWESLVKGYMGSHCGEELDIALDIMQTLKDGVIDEAYFRFLRKTEYLTYNQTEFILSVIERFCEKGKEFTRRVKGEPESEM